MIELYNRGEDSIISVSNESLDIENYSVISKKLRDSVGDLNGRRIIFDLSKIKIIDSVGIGLIAMIRNLSLRKGVEVVLACEDVYMLKIIKVLNAAYSFKIFNSVVQAIEHDG